MHICLKSTTLSSLLQTIRESENSISRFLVVKKIPSKQDELVEFVGILTMYDLLRYCASLE